ncbi:flavodoxin [Paratractidigestivibacter sp.]|uniref:flavodoxin n=1 Tax=Paratractidigestivibacter sp. TaxID=2847316 RepID=UPI002ABE4571|nr:flavodoxin [Paratractidigestivibacter sp.]
MSKSLIAYFSRAGQNYVSGDIVELPRGNGAVLADFAAAATGDDLFEIRREAPYASDYRECVAESRDELAANARPKLAADCDPAPYDDIVLIYPNWCGTMPMPVYTWLEAHNFAGKTIHPLCTHEGSGLVSTGRDIATACPGATVAPGLSVKGSEAARSESVVRNWLR